MQLSSRSDSGYDGVPGLPIGCGRKWLSSGWLISVGRLQVGTALLIVALAGIARSAEPCGPAASLPAYSHNDYRGDRPCLEALELGYLGLEADVVYRDGAFLLAHSRKEARAGFDLETTYLLPLLERVRQCSRVTADPRPFLLTIEDKAPTTASRLALAALFERYSALLQPSAAGPIAEFILVDEAAAPGSVPAELARCAGLQWRVTSHRPVPPAEAADAYHLLSLDYGEEIDWDGSGPPPAEARRLVREVVDAARRVPGCRVRVHHAPARRSIWSWLLREGVDLIGVTDLPRGVALLESGGMER